MPLASRLRRLTPTSAVTDLTAALLRLQADPIHRAQLAQAGRLRVDQEFNWERTGEKLARIYQGLLGDEKSIIQSDRIEDAVVATQER